MEHDVGYSRWFAWRPVMLRCPEGLGDPQKRYRKVAWMRVVWRMRSETETYYALFPGIDDPDHFS